MKKSIEQNKISQDISKKINSLPSIGAEKQVPATLRKIIVNRIKDYESKLSRLTSDISG